MKRKAIVSFFVCGLLVFSISTVDTRRGREPRTQQPESRSCGAAEGLPGASSPSPRQGPIWLTRRHVVVADSRLGRVLQIGRDLNGKLRTDVLADLLQDPQAVAILRGSDSDTVFVTETAGGRITRITLDQGGTKKETVRSELSMPVGIAIDSCRGDLLVTTLGDGRLVRISPDGNNLTVVAEGLKGPTGVAVSQDGTIFIAESLTGSLLKVPGDGTDRSQVVDGLLKPEMIAWARSGVVYVAESAGGQITEVNPQTGERRVVISGLDGPVGVAPRDELDALPSVLAVTHDRELLDVVLATGESRLVAPDITGAGCVVVPGGSERGTFCFVNARCQLAGRTLTVSGTVTCHGIGVCNARVELRLLFLNRTQIGPFEIPTDTNGNYQFTNPELTDDRVRGGGTAIVRVGAHCGACEGNVGNQCRF